MKICILDESLFARGLDAVNGARAQSLALAHELAGRGHDLFVLSGRDPRNTVDTPGEREGIPVHTFPRSFRLPFLGARAASRALRRLGPDVVYVRGRSYLAGVAAWERRRRGRAFVWASNAEEGCERWKQLRHLWRGPRPLIRKVARTPLDLIADLMCDLGVTRADRHVCQTRYQCARLLAVHGREGLVVRSLHSPPGSLPPKAVPPLVVWVGRVSVDRIPEAFVTLARDSSDVDADFALVGPTSSPEYLRRVLAPAAGLSRFRYIGEVPMRESWDWIARAAVLVNTSKMEGVSNALVQAWHCGTPTVVLHFDPDGIIATNEVGFLSGDPDTLARDVRRLLEEKSLREAMGGRAQALAARDFSGSSVGAIYEDLMRQAAAEARQAVARG